MPAEHRRFLLSFKAGEPEWDLLGVPGAADLPAVRWKVDNLAKLSEGRTRFCKLCSAVAGSRAAALTMWIARTSALQTQPR